MLAAQGTSHDSRWKGSLVRKSLLILLGIVFMVIVTALVLVVWLRRPPKPLAPAIEIGETIMLPQPRVSSATSIEVALSKRRSVRSYSDAPLTLAQVSQLLWAAQGVTDSRGFRTAPSAGALYPLELYLVVGAVEGLEAGVYHYMPAPHQLQRIASGDKREELAAAALGQSCVRRGTVVLVYAAVYERTTRKYGQRGRRYVYMEVGHAAQNVHLQAVALDLGAVVVGSFDDDHVREVLHLPEDHEPLYIMPIGYPAH